MVIAFTLQRTEQRAIRRTDDTRVGGCLSGRWKMLDFSNFPDCAGVLPHKIRAERSSNGSWRSHPALAELSRAPACPQVQR